jgi:hypothetical protein
MAAYDATAMLIRCNSNTQISPVHGKRASEWTTIPGNQPASIQGSFAIRSGCCKHNKRNA